MIRAKREGQGGERKGALSITRIQPTPFSCVTKHQRCPTHRCSSVSRGAGLLAGLDPFSSCFCFIWFSIHWFCSSIPTKQQLSTPKSPGITGRDCPLLHKNTQLVGTYPSSAATSGSKGTNVQSQRWAWHSLLFGAEKLASLPPSSHATPFRCVTTNTARTHTFENSANLGETKSETCAIFNYSGEQKA